MSKRLLRGEIHSYQFKLVYSALLQCCTTGLMLCGNRGRDGQAASRAHPQQGGENRQHLQTCTVPPKDGTEALIKKPDLQGASQPARAPAPSQCPQHTVLTGPSMLKRHARQPDRKCDLRSKAYTPSLSEELDCRYFCRFGIFNTIINICYLELICCLTMGPGGHCCAVC